MQELFELVDPGQTMVVIGNRNTIRNIRLMDIRMEMCEAVRDGFLIAVSAKGEAAEIPVGSETPDLPVYE